MPKARERSATVGTRNPSARPSVSIHLHASRAISSRGPRQLPEHRMSQPTLRCSGISPLMTAARSATDPALAGPSER
eukprot:9374004-Alexandrium_andersonii.AAC.1